MRISDWSSDVCSSDLLEQHPVPSKDFTAGQVPRHPPAGDGLLLFELHPELLARPRLLLRARASRAMLCRLCAADDASRPCRAGDCPSYLLCPAGRARTRVVWGKSVSVRLDLACARHFTKKKQ